MASKNISLSQDDCNKVKNKEMSLLEFLNANVSKVSEEEQLEFESLNLDLSDTTGEELSISQVLKSNYINYK